MTVVAIVGLGYVGLPLVVEFGKRTRTFGLDVDEKKVARCRAGIDLTNELSREEMGQATLAQYSTDPRTLNEADFVIVAVPTPVDDAHRPDFRPLISASRTIGENLRRGAVVIYESTVYPGATEEVCIPALEKASGMVWKRDFFVGYSPERINPGDKEHMLTKVVKVVSGDSPETLDKVAALYEMIVEPGVHRCSSIKAAEACKVIENTQRDLNIALMNELSVIFSRMGIDTSDVVAAAATKWNFTPFRPGLVGGHCIGVDPYYLTYQAERLGYIPQVILAGRRINDNMGRYVARNVIKRMLQNGMNVTQCRVGVLGITFKENCPDTRNSKVVDIITELRDHCTQVVVVDPHADAAEVRKECGIELVTMSEALAEGPLDALIVAVGHREFREMDPAQVLALVRKDRPVIADVKALYDRDALSAAGAVVFRL